VGAVANWRERAGCRDADPITFFEAYEVDEAKRICAGCPVREPCLEYALRTEQLDGVWGGASEGEREQMIQVVTPVGTAAEAPFDRFTYQTRTRSTGAVCSIGKGDGGWGVLCETHGSRALTSSRAAAGSAVVRPQRWCPTCRRITDGHLPKVTEE
jgi:WhiB family redox-sensing transcriptional regulator